MLATISRCAHAKASSTLDLCDCFIPLQAASKIDIKAEFLMLGCGVVRDLSHVTSRDPSFLGLLLTRSLVQYSVMYSTL